MPLNMLCRGSGGHGDHSYATWDRQAHRWVLKRPHLGMCAAIPEHDVLQGHALHLHGGVEEVNRRRWVKVLGNVICAALLHAGHEQELGCLHDLDDSVC